MSGRSAVRASILVTAVLVLSSACSSGSASRTQSADRPATSQPASSAGVGTTQAPGGSGTSRPASTRPPATTTTAATQPPATAPNVHLDLNQTGCSSAGGAGTTLPGVNISGAGGLIQTGPNGVVIQGPNGEQIDASGCFAGPQCSVAIGSGSGSVVISAGAGRAPCGFGVTGFPQVQVPEITDPTIAVQQGPGAAIITVAADVLFDFDHSDIRPDAAGTLRQVAALLAARWPGRPVELRGHTDAIGEAAYNDDLSLRRAEATKAWLVANAGLTPAALTTVGLGSKVPVAPNTVPGGGDNPTGRQLNRRVEIVVGTG